MNLGDDRFHRGDTLQFRSQVETGTGPAALVPVQVEEASALGHGNFRGAQPIDGVVNVSDGQIEPVLAMPGEEDVGRHGGGDQQRNPADPAAAFLKRAEGSGPFVK